MWLTQGNLNVKVTRATDAEVEWLRSKASGLTFGNKKTLFTTGQVELTRFFDLLDFTFPAGFLPMVLANAASAKIQTQVIDGRTAPALPIPGQLGWLRDYQVEAVEMALAKTRGILKLPTGAGKTEAAVGLVKSVPIRWLFLVHRMTLMEQAAQRYELRCPGETAGRIGEGAWSPKERFTVATFQTLAALQRRFDAVSKKRFSEYMASIQGVIIDECFPAGTFVGDTPIENIQIGDLVPSYDERTGKFCARRVLKTFKTPARSLLRVTLTDGRAIVCTEGHPFLTMHGWKAAIALSGQHVLCSKHDTMSQLLKIVRAEQTTTIRHEETRHEAGLLQSMQTPPPTISARTNCALSTYAAEQPHAVTDNGDENVRNTESTWRLVSESARGQWYGANGAAEEATHGLGQELEARTGGGDRHAATSFQAGHRAPSTESLCRSGWHDSQEQEGKRARRPQGSDSEWVGVARVEVFEPRNSSERERVCPGGVVYNLHIEGTETYLVGEGIIAHNCHVLPAESFWKVTQALPNAYYRIGVSGTPLDREDQRSVFAVGALGPQVYEIPSAKLIEEGRLAKPNIRMVTAHQDFMEKDQFGLIRRWGWAKVYREGIVRSKERNRILLAAVTKAEKPCLVFVKEIAHGRAFAKALQKRGIKADFVWGSDSLQARQQAVKRLVRGDLEVLVCSVIFQEGVDIPELRSVVIASGGKSIIAALQRIGRGMRRADGKETFEVWDVADEGNVWLKRHAKARRRAYQREGYAVSVVTLAPLLPTSSTDNTELQGKLKLG